MVLNGRRIKKAMKRAAVMPKEVPIATRTESCDTWNCQGGSLAGKREHATYLSTEWVILHQLLKLLFHAQVPPEQRTTGNGSHSECGSFCDGV